MEEEVRDATVEEVKEEPEPVEKPPEQSEKPPEPPQPPEETREPPKPPEAAPVVAQQPVDVEKGAASPEQIDEISTGHYYTIKQLASDLGYSESWIYNLVSDGRIKAVKPLGGRWRIPPSEVRRITTEGIPPMPRAKPEVDASEIRVEGKHVDRVQPREKPEEKEGKRTINLLEFLRKEE